MKHTKYGCLPSKADVRDYKFKSSATAELPEVFRLSHFPRVKNQGSVSSCVAHSMSSILEYHAHEDKLAEEKLSTAFIYGIQKKLFGREDGGMYLRDACKIVNTYGDMTEADCPGNKEVPAAHNIAEEAFNDADKLKTAEVFKVASYVRVDKTKDIKRSIMNHGPVLASVKWYDTFKCDSNDVLTGEQKGDYGYHAIILLGWCSEGFIAQNSWGKSFGDHGRFILPFSISVREAWQIVDADTTDIIKPIEKKFISIFYRLFNYIINLFRK